MARPNLWSIFELWVDVPVSSPESPKLVSLLQHHLTFSGTLPLTVSCSGSIEKGWKHPAIELFLQHSHRWYILSSAYSIIDTSNHYPLLERLDLPSIDTSKGPLVAPRLWSLSWAIFHPDHIQEPNIPWDQLREIVPPQISPQQCADIFSRCSRLESATVAIRESDEDEDGPNIIHSSTLVHLSLEYPTFMDSLQHRLGDLFRITSFPCLEELTLVNESPPTNWTKDEFAAFTLRSPHISILHLRDLNMHIRDLMDLLHLLPTLTEFDFHRISRSYTSLDPLFSGLRLFHHSNQDVLLPRLTKLELRIPSHFDYMIFVEMAKSRWNPPKPVAILRSLRLHSDPVSFDDEMLSSLIELREAGMMIDITDRSGVIV